GCGTQALVKDIARHTTVYAYEWAPHNGPGIVQSPGYANGAGHASELAYLWPNFKENGVRISSLFTRDERQLAQQIVDYWGAFVKTVRRAPQASRHGHDTPRHPPSNCHYAPKVKAGRSTAQSSPPSITARSGTS
ncbi:MAG: carboxylesterase family protein, partial [Solirubrobacteraceae bacterium]